MSSSPSCGVGGAQRSAKAETDSKSESQRAKDRIEREISVETVIVTNKLRNDVPATFEEPKPSLGACMTTDVGVHEIHAVTHAQTQNGNFQPEIATAVKKLQQLRAKVHTVEHRDTQRFVRVRVHTHVYNLHAHTTTLIKGKVGQGPRSCDKEPSEEKMGDEAIKR